MNLYKNIACIGLGLAALSGGSVLTGFRSTASPQLQTSGPVSLAGDVVGKPLASVRPMAPKLDPQHTQNGNLKKAEARKMAQKLLKEYYNDHEFPYYPSTIDGDIFDNGDRFGINNEEGGGKPFVTVIQFLLKEYLDKRPSEDLYSDEIQRECQALFDELVNLFFPNLNSTQIDDYTSILYDILDNKNPTTTIQDIKDKLNEKVVELDTEYSSEQRQTKFSTNPR